ncbi:DNA polymerase III subunit epsilon [Buchnera aphidicola (Takecallis arundicolens)]|uniref:DNA polymerase III subunit epsilon n=1 Tax=Buchnera aphidicola TaxID=9 RepID=UPI0034645A61
MNNKIDRKIALDIETTGLNNSGLLYKNHKIIEIGAIEIINRKITNNKFHVYINPEREINNEAFKIHGISNKFLIDKPLFSDIYLKLIAYISNSDIIAHNANFDISFINYEIKKLNKNFKTINKFCKVIDTLEIARNIFPGKKNNLDALCNRYEINNNSRKIHSAVLDAFLVAKIYLRMTCLQKQIQLDNITSLTDFKKEFDYNLKIKLNILKATNSEKKKHKRYLKYMEKLGNCLWMN